MSDREQSDSDSGLDDAIAWFLAQTDEGIEVTADTLVAEFPAHENELRRFLAVERRIAHIGDEINRREVPEIFGKYQLMELLGRGSFGEVRKACDTQLLRTVAVKTPRYLCQDEDSIRRFLREARTASQLAHQNIVRTYEVGEFESIPFIATEYIDGVSLNEWGGARPLSVQSAVEIVVALAAGLEHAHERGVIHRDLNPRNVMMDEDDTPKLLDFGLAKLVEGLSTVTIQGETLGTPAYVSPEQVKGSSEVDGRSDLYSLGVIFYELMIGKRPFDGNLRLLLHRVQFETPKAPHEVNPQIPRSFSDICLRCLSKNPASRFQSAAELIVALENPESIAEPHRDESANGECVAENAEEPAALSNAISANGSQAVAQSPVDERPRATSIRDWVGNRNWQAIAGWFAVGSQSLITVWMILSDLFKIRFGMWTVDEYLELLPQLLLMAVTTSLTVIVAGVFCALGYRLAAWIGAGLAVMNLWPTLVALLDKPSFFGDIYETTQPYFTFQIHLVISLVCFGQLVFYLIALAGRRASADPQSAQKPNAV